MKQYINNNFKLCISSQIFVNFNLYLLPYNNVKDQEFLDSLQNGLKSNSVDLDELFISTNTISYNYKLTDTNNFVNISKYNLSFKTLNAIDVNTTHPTYNVPDNINTLIGIQVKKFDKNNYIIPLMISYDLKSLVDADRFIDFGKFQYELNNKKDLSNLISKYNII